MNKKRIWYIIPAALLPYAALLVLATIFFSTRHRIFGFIVEEIFQGNIWFLLAAFFLFCLLSTALSTICFVKSIREKWDPLSLAKYAMITKLIQIPAYILIYILGVLLFISIFTFAFSIGLFLLDCLAVVLTGLLTIAAAINAIRWDIFRTKEVLWIIILQFIFCADVAASIVLYRKLKKRLHNDTELLHK